MKNVHKLTIRDLISIRRRETSVKIDANLGDLIEIYFQGDVIIGTVLFIDDELMQILDTSGQKRWFSRYLKYKKHTKM